MPRPRPVVCAVLVAQAAVPLTMLALRWADEGSRPQVERPASWQMYSQAPRPAYTGVDAAGRARALDADALPLLVRAVGTGRVVPDRLCDREPDLVEVRRAGGPDPGRFAC